MKIRVALTNLGKYNEGELAFEWLELPYDAETLAEAKRKIGIGDEYEEYFISDYEAPFEIGEYESLAKLNEIAEQLEAVDIPEAILAGNYDGGDVINFGIELCSAGIVPYGDELVSDIVSTEYLDEMIEHVARSGGWPRVKFFLGGIEWMNDEYYLINGYGNVENLTHDYLEMIVDELMGEMKYNLT